MSAAATSACEPMPAVVSGVILDSCPQSVKRKRVTLKSLAASTLVEVVQSPASQSKALTLSMQKLNRCAMEVYNATGMHVLIALRHPDHSADVTTIVAPKNDCSLLEPMVHDPRAVVVRNSYFGKESTTVCSRGAPLRKHARELQQGLVLKLLHRHAVEMLWAQKDSSHDRHRDVVDLCQLNTKVFPKNGRRWGVGKGFAPSWWIGIPIEWSDMCAEKAIRNDKVEKAIIGAAKEHMSADEYKKVASSHYWNK